MDVGQLIVDFKNIADKNANLTFNYIDKSLDMVHLSYENVPHWNKRILVTTGIHGNEPAGPLAVHRFLRDELSFLRKETRTRVDFIPIINSCGLRAETRNGCDGGDLNRDFIATKSDEIKTYKEYCESNLFFTTFDSIVCMHEDDESDGFYLHYNYIHNEPWGFYLANKMRETHTMNDRQYIDGYPAYNSVIHHRIAEIGMESFEQSWFARRHCNSVFTPETDLMLPLGVRIEQQIEFLKMVIVQTES